MIRRPPILLALLLVVACDAGTPPTAVDVPEPSYVLLDGSTTGNTHFYFLAPIVPGDPPETAPFDGSHLPRVEICEWEGMACAAGPPAFSYTATSGTGGEVVRVSDDHYVVDWHTNVEGVEPEMIFRVRVLALNLELGSVDFQIGATGKDVKDINTGYNFGLVDGRTLPIRFRIEEGAIQQAETQAESECLEGDDVIDCDVVVVSSTNGGNATVVEELDGGQQTPAAIVTIDENDVVDANGDPVDQFALTLEHVESAPAPAEDIPLAQQIPFFIDVTAVDNDGNPVFFVNGAELTLCQPPDLGNSGADLFIPDELHEFLVLYQVNSLGETEILPTTLDNQANCPGGLHGGLNTVGIRSFSGFGSTLPTLPSASTAVVPSGFVDAATVIDIQARVSADDDQIFGGDSVVVTVSGANTASGTVIDNGDGTYTAEYTPTTTGTDAVVIEIRNIDTGNLEPISGSPFTSLVCEAPSSVSTVQVTLGADCTTPGVVPTMEIAMTVVEPGGTILMDDGTHAVEDVVVDKPVTIDEVGGASATIQNDAALRSLRIDGVGTGLVTIRNLDFVNNSPGSNETGLRTSSIQAKGTYDQLVIEDNTFTNVPDSANSAVRSDTTSVSGASVLIQRNTFSGGRTGVVATGVDESGPPPAGVFNAFVSVRENDFSDHIGRSVQFQTWSDGDVTDNDAIRCGGACIQYQNASNGTISLNRVEDCGEAGCIRVFGGNVDVLDNEITDATPEPASPAFYHNAIRFGSGAVGAISGNDIDGCGWGACIQVGRGAVADVESNDIFANLADHTEFGILAFGGDDPILENNDPPTVTVTGNVVSGVGTGSDRNVDDDYGFYIAAVQVRNATVTSLSGNAITNAARGIRIFQNGTIVSGADNTVDFTRVAVGSFGNGSITIQDSDFTDWIVSIRDDDGTLTGSVACNWWGSVDGPDNNELQPGSSIVYAPWTDGPVAGAATASCNLFPPVVGLSAFGTATIDGVQAVGEWDAAAQVGVFAGGPNAGSTFYVMNDGTSLYLALELIGDAALSASDVMEVRFDNGLDGVDTEGDDNLFLSTGGFSDAGFRDGVGWGIGDASVDGGGAVGTNAGVHFFEMAHPLASGDPNDFSLLQWDALGFCLRFFDEDGSSSTTQVYQPGCVLAVNDQALYEPITIAAPPLP